MPSEVNPLAQGPEVGHIRKSSAQLPVAVRPLPLPLSLISLRPPTFSQFVVHQRNQTLCCHRRPIHDS